DDVVATARHLKKADELNKLVTVSGGRGTVVRLDVADPAEVATAALQIGERFDALDLLINNAGIWSAPGEPERVSAGALAELRPEPVLEVLRVNAVAPMLVTQALAPRLATAGRGLVVNLSSGLGSLEWATSRGNVAYGMSKAALNMLTRHLAAELSRQGIVVVSMSPGWVATDMGGPSAALEPPEAVHGMLNVIDALTPAQSGSFLDHTGATLPW
ncbi:MAG TPA: SDR family oxidoreductase, partial [Acidimicrobiia bacterium]|nr:SDR family oxidoreductase [Acidimicrobiia bacterium]